MAFVEKTGKSVEEAVAAALKELNVTAEKAVVEVLEEGKKGLFGFFGKDAKVRVTVKEAEAAVSVDEKEETPVVEKIEEPAPVEVEETKAEPVAAPVAEPVPEAKETVREPKKFVVNEEGMEKAKEFLQKVFGAMKIEVVMEKFINKGDGSVTFKLHGDDMGILIGKHGQTLDSLQYLTNLVANKNSNERIRVIIDVEDYRERRIETLNRLAYRLADKVKRSGERVALEPMNPHERKIIHMALQNDRRVTTLSEGDEPHRHVVIELKK